MNDDQLLRYARHILLPQIGIEGQQRLLDARVLIVGLGGLGSPVAMYLAASGVGHLVLADFDTVELSNLQRQLLHRTADLGRPKVESARDTVLALNPEVAVTPLPGVLDEAALADQVRQADLVVDCSDNFHTRFQLNAACVSACTPLVSGAAIRFEGQVSVFSHRSPGVGPCYRCLYADVLDIQETCSQSGVLAPLVGIIGAMQAAEAVKLLAGVGESLEGRLLLLDGLRMEWRTMRLPRDPACPICGNSSRVAIG